MDVGIFSSGSMDMTTGTERTFCAELFGHIAANEAADNVILSPLSIQSCLGLIYLGTQGSTAAELVKGLRLESFKDKTEIAEQFGKLFEKASSDKDAIMNLKIANRVYLDERYEIASGFNELAEQYFGATVEKVDFAQSHSAADNINAWVEEKTEHKIQNMIASDSLDASTASVLVNGVYFKALWQKEFDGFATQKKDFSLGENNKIEVDMMSQEDRFPYGDLKELNAKAVELEYRGTDISMLIMLPNEIGGLSALEEKLKTVDLCKLSDAMRMETVRLSLPKFRVEYDLSLQATLEKMGIREIFAEGADFGDLLAKPQPLHVDEVKHKAFLEVNEMGTEAAAATYGKIYLDCLMVNEVIYDFVADHPFVFAIKDSEHVYFVGHIRRPQ